jgi:uncharacterized membrane protein
MGKVRIQAHVEAPIEAVFDYSADISHAPEWNVMTIDMAGDAPLSKVGDRFTGTMKFLGRTYTGEGEVTAFERPRVIAFVSTSPDGGHQNWTTRYTPAGTGTDLETEVDYEVPMGLVGAIGNRLFVEKMVQRALQQSRDNFVAIVEQRVLQPV